MNTRQIYDAAPGRLENAPLQKRIVLIYAAITVAAAAFITAIDYILDLQIAQTGGLSSLGQRSMLSTFQSLLPTVQMVAMLCLELGYTNAMLRIARGQYASEQSLRLGFDRFGPLVRAMVLEALIYMGVGMLSFYAAVQIYLFTPYADRLIEILSPYSTSLLSAPGSFMLDEAVQLQVLDAMIPLFLIFAVLGTVLCVPVIYQYRMVNYILIDNPRIGGFAALRASRLIMRRNRLRLFQLDLRLWWYHLLSLLTMAVCYGDWILALLGIQLPLSAEVVFYGFYALYLAAQFVICYFLRNRVDVTYALAYEALRPREESNSVVLGNIFQM